MKQCPICGRDVLSKRRDAVFCQNAACRKKAHQTRRQQPAPRPSPPPTDKAAAELTFPDGSRWRVELTPLITIPAGNRSGTDLATRSEQPRSDPPTSPPQTTTACLSDQIPAVAPEPAAAASAPLMQHTPQTSNSPPPSPALSPAPVSTAPAQTVLTEPASSPTVTTGPASPTPQSLPLHTVELYFTDEHGTRMPFDQAVRPRWPGYRLRAYVIPRLGMRLRDGYGLGGTPGQFQTHYPGRSPRDFGFDDDIAVLCADEASDRALAPDADLLQAAIGASWRTRVRACVTEHKRTNRSSQ